MREGDVKEEDMKEEANLYFEERRSATMLVHGVSLLNDDALPLVLYDRSDEECQMFVCGAFYSWCYYLEVSKKKDSRGGTEGKGRSRYTKCIV